MGRVRWCKGNHTGLRSVISEWICARLARQLGLPVPDFSIMKLDNLLVNGKVYIIDHNNAFDPAFSEEAFSDEHILRGYRDLISDEEKADFVRSAAELCGGTFIDEVWSEMPEEWTDAGSVVLPLSSIRKSLEESTHVGNVL